MKDKMLKIAGVKSEAEFYKKFPTEKAFMAKHGAAFKKAAMGKRMVDTQLDQLTNFTNYGKAANGIDVNSLLGGLGFNADGSNFKENAFNLKVGQGISNLDQSLGKVGGIGGAAGIAGDLVQGFQQLAEEKRQKKQAKQLAGVSDITRQAAELEPDVARRKYVRPEDQLLTPDQNPNPYGVGTNFLAEDGAMIGGNPTEIQNMYVPGTIYDDLGFEPLEDSAKVKQYNKGGKLKKGQFGFADKPAGQLGDALGSLIGGGKGRPTAGGKIGSTIGSTVGKFIPIPGASTVLSAVGGIAGGILGGKSAKETMGYQDKAMNNATASAFTKGAKNFQAQNSAFLADGGWVSHDWQPQVITKFGEHSVKDLLTPPKDAEMLRAGGHLKSYTPPSESAMETYAMGGELETHWGGGAEVISQNPYLPDGGETIMFKGNSHEESDGKGRTGIGVTFGDSEVEVEGGEPAVKLKDGGTGEDNMVVYGNMFVPNYVVSELEDDDAKGKKFKSYANHLSKIESKQNKIIEKNLKMLEDVDDGDDFGKLKVASIESNILGANMTLKQSANKKKILAYSQDAILSTAEEMGVEPDMLAKGKIKHVKDSGIAKFGAKMETAQKGVKKGAKKPIKIDIKPFLPTPAQLAAEDAAFRAANPEEKIAPFDSYRSFVENEHPVESFTSLTPLPTAGELKQNEAARNAARLAQSQRKSLFDQLSTAYNSVLPFIRPSNAEELSGEQIYPELAALALNEERPVQAQYYRPLLPGAPAQVSYQDQLNAIQSDFNSIQRLVGYNPAALSQLAAQKYKATSQILGEELRTNVGAKQQYYDQVRNTLNEATLKNLGIEEQKYLRSEAAKSATKQQSLEALSSIASKIAQNKLENRTLGVYENLYNYRFTPRGQAVNINPLAQFNTEGNPYAKALQSPGRELAPGKAYSYDELGNIVGIRSLTKEEQGGRNGKIVKSFKNF